jgi:AsmA protein
VLTLEGQGRTSNPVGLGIPVAIDGPWVDPRIYPDMAGMMDNPDAAYARLKEMGKGLFGANGGGLGSMLGGLGGDGASAGSNGGSSDPLGGKLGETLGNLLQQGLSQSRGVPTTPPAPQTPPSATTPPPQADPPQAQPDSQPMNDVLRQLFNR